MDLTNLEERELSIGRIYLDPNNPRFWSEQTRKAIPDRKVPDPDVQAEALGHIEGYGIEELANSILRNGFLPLDRIVVRPLAGVDDAYVVVEGNRRLAALKTLRKQIDQELIDEVGIEPSDLEHLKQDTEQISVLVYTGADAADVSWILQGIRHISGIKDWQPAQRAKLVADQIEKEGIGLKEAGQRFGLSAQAVGRLYRSFKALEQMRNDEEFSSKAKNEWFTLFEEAIRNVDVKQWLGWNEDDKRFVNTDLLRRFYSWIIPDEDRDGRRRIHDPRQIKKLGTLITGNHEDLLSQIDDHQITIDAAHDRVEQGSQRYDWNHALAKAKQLVADIPQAAIAEQPREVLAALDSLANSIEKLRTMATSVQENG